VPAMAKAADARGATRNSSTPSQQWRLSQFILLWLFSFLFHENEIKDYFFSPSVWIFVVVAITQIHISKVCLGGHT